MGEACRDAAHLIPASHHPPLLHIPITHQAIVAAPEVAKEYSQQIVETEHLLKALLEQPNGTSAWTTECLLTRSRTPVPLVHAGLARRIFSKAGSDPTRLLERTDAFIRKQPKVSGESAQVRW